MHKEQKASEKLTATRKVRSKKKNIQMYMNKSRREGEKLRARDVYFELHICLNLKLMEE